MAEDHDPGERAKGGADAALAATREILSAIRTHRGDEKPVFDVILENACRLCNAQTAFVAALDDAETHLVIPAWRGASDAFAEGLKEFRHEVTETHLTAVQAMVERRVIRIDDIADTDTYRQAESVRVFMVDVENIRSLATVPLLSGDRGIGSILLYRREVDPFTDKDIALIEGFAEQAVVAIENARQFRELQTRLEREAASAEILEIISQSRDDEQPVFEAILSRAERLCSAQASGLQLVTEAGTHLRTMAGTSLDKGVFAAGLEFPLDRPLGMCIAVREARVVHIEDLKDTDLYREGDPTRLKMVDELGAHTQLAVPLMRRGVAFGNINLTRSERKPFTPDEVALIETFATQAVIAIENVRQFREVQERLERERASAEILQVISQSRDNDKPVFDVILKNACALCNAQQAALILGAAQDSVQTMAAQVNVAPAAIELYETGQMPMDSGVSYAARSIIEARLVAFDDMRDSDLYTAGSAVVRSMVDDSGIRSVLFAPLIKAGAAIGNITLFRSAVDPFKELEISLIETFAAQAVIAIENVRQFRELQERLERERATKEVLSVISKSRDDEKPVFNKILTLARELCEAEMTTLLLVNPDRTALTYIGAAGTEISKLEAGFTIPIDDPMGVAAAVRTGEVVNNPDLKDDDLYRKGHPVRVRLVDEEGIRSQLAVPMVQGDQTIGVLALNRREQKAFTADEVALIESFAAQAVIAIENVRQFKALETLNAELGDRVQDQVGEIERMGRLKRFLPAAVADAIVTSGDESMLTSHRAMVATLFCDMRGFTAFCEAAEPEETIEVLQTYHQEMSDLIDEYGGGVDQRAGDGIMVIFNDPITVDDPAGDAVRLAVAMRAKMRELCAGWKRLGHRLGFGIGISLGYATVGMVGSAGRFDYTASGTSVNTAARLCDMAADGEILISPRVWVAVEGDFQAESRGEVEMKGIREPVEVFAVT